MTRCKYGFLTKCAEYGVDSYELIKLADTRLAKMIRAGKLGKKTLDRLAAALSTEYRNLTAEKLVDEFVSKHRNGKKAGRLIRDFRRGSNGRQYSNLGEYLLGNMFPDEVSKLTGVTHNIRGDKFVRDLRNLPDKRSRDVGDFVDSLITNEGLPLRRMRFTGIRDGVGGSDKQVIAGGYVRKTMGSKKRFSSPESNAPTTIFYGVDDKDPFHNIVRAPEGSMSSGGALFVGDYDTAGSYVSPISAYIGDEYLFKDLSGKPLSMSDYSLRHMVERGMPKHVADSIRGRSKGDFVPGERTIRNYISRKGFAPPGDRTEFIRDAGGKIDDVTHVGVDIPYSDYFNKGLSVSERQARNIELPYLHGEGAKLMFRQSGARSRSAAVGSGDPIFTKRIIQEFMDPRVSIDLNAPGHSYYRPKIIRVSDITPKLIQLLQTH